MLAMYEQEMKKDRLKPSYQKLKSMVTRQKDQNAKFSRLRQEYSRLKKKRNASVDRKVGECYHWKATGQCVRETLAVSATDPIMVREYSRPYLLQKAQTQTDERKPSKGVGPR